MVKGVQKMSSQRFLTTREYAQKIGVSPSTVSKWLRSGKLQGQKQNGKWVIAEDTATASSKTSSPLPQSDAPEKTERKSDIQSFSVQKFSKMTYLTELGVLKWLKEGRLKGSKDVSGEWRVSSQNLEDANVKRLLRN